MLKKTALCSLHKELGAKLVDFAGYEMPIWYQNAKDEHMAVRNSSGIFDVSHMGMVHFKGVNALPFLQRVCTNDIEKTLPNKILYTMILNEDGGILDDVMVGHNTQLDAFFMVINASNKAKIMKWFYENGLDKVAVELHFDDFGLLAIQGPNIQSSLENIMDIDWVNLPPFHSQMGQLFDHDALIMRTGYTGEDGIEISVKNHGLATIWKACLDAGIAPCGLAARDTLRIEYGLPLYGHELSELVTPLETRYPWVLKWDTNFIGSSVLSERQTEQQFKTVGLKFDDRCLPRQGYKIVGGGVVTSGTFSPILNCPIAMAMVPLHVDLYSVIQVEIRSKVMDAKVVSLPFI